MKPLSSHVLVKKPEPLLKTESGILLTRPADDTSTNVQEGIVVAVGEGRYENGVLIPMQTKVGDTVLFAKFAQYPICKHNGENHFLIIEQGLLAIL